MQQILSENENAFFMEAVQDIANDLERDSIVTKILSALRMMSGGEYSGILLQKSSGKGVVLRFLPPVLPAAVRLVTEELLRETFEGRKEKRLTVRSRAHAK